MGKLNLKRGKRVAAWATVATLLMAAGKGLVGYLAGSVALRADAVHTAADAMAIFASWFGLSLSMRPPSEKFPYGYYRAETIASLIASVLILYAGGTLFLESLGKFSRPPTIELPFLGMAVAGCSAFLSLLIAGAEKRTGRDLFSLSLQTNADESMADILTSSLVFFAIGSSYLGIRFVEPATALALSLLILWIGLKTGRIGLYSLMDASLEPEMEKSAIGVMRATEGVKEVDKVRIRCAGPFLFGEAHLKVAGSLDVARGHEISHRAVAALKGKIPRIEAMSIHLEPYRPAERVTMVPLHNNRGDASLPSAHFGKAPFFAFSVAGKGGFSPPEIVANPFLEKEVRVGLAVARRFVAEKRVEALLISEIGEIGFHTLRDMYVEVYRLRGESLGKILENFASGKLERIETPTHSSDDKIERPGSPTGRLRKARKETDWKGE